MLTFLASVAVAAEAPALRVATYAYPRFDRRQALAPLASHLSERLGRRTEIVLVGSPEELRVAIEQRKVDLAVTNLATFLSVAEDRKVEPIAVLAVPQQTLAQYRGVLVVRADTGIRRLDELGSAASTIRYVEVLPGSTSGGLVQRRALESAGIAWSCFIRLAPAGTHEKALEQLLKRQADLAALAEEPWRRLRTADPAAAAKLIPLWTSAPLPPGPIVCVRGKASPCNRIRAALLTRSNGVEAAAKALAQGWSETAGATGFVAFETVQRFPGHDGARRQAPPALQCAR